jgi:hypothetical protein
MIRAIHLPGLLLLLFGLALLPPAHAATVSNLYGAVVPVADRSQAETDRGIVRALGVVIVKLTGQRATLEAPAGRSLLDRAGKFVTVVGHEAGGTDAEGYRLRVDFDARAVAGALRERGAVLWGAQRPQTLAWVLVEDAEGRRFVPDARYPELRDAVNDQAAVRGIPLARGSVGGELAASLTALPPAELLTALVGDSAPLTPEPTPVAAPVQAPRLAGHLRTEDGLSWQGRWRIVIDGVASDWETSGETAAAVAAAGVDKAADALGRHFANPAVFGGGVARLELSVQGIASPNDYGRVFSHLRGLDNVTAIGVKRVSGSAVLFELSARGGLPAVTENLRLTSVLQPVAEQPGTYTLAGR